MSLIDKPIPQPTVLRLLSGHRAWVWTLAGSRDERFIAAAGNNVDDRIRIWESQTGELFRVLSSNLENVTKLAFGHDAHQLYSVGFSGKLTKWNLEKGEAQTLVDSSGRLTALTISKKGVIAAGGDEKKVYLFDAQHQPIVFFETDNKIYSLAFSHDGNQLAIGMTGGSLQLATRKSGTWVCSQSWKHHTNAIFTLCFSPDDAFLITGSDDGHVLVHDLKKMGQNSRELYQGDSWVRSLMFADPETLVIGSKKLFILTFPKGKPRLLLDGFPCSIDGLVLFGNGRYLATSKNAEKNEETKYDPCVFDFGASNLGRGASCIWDEMPI